MKKLLTIDDIKLLTIDDIKLLLDIIDDKMRVYNDKYKILKNKYYLKKSIKLMKLYKKIKKMKIMKIKYKNLDYKKRLENEVKKIFFNLNDNFINNLIPIMTIDELIDINDVYEDFDKIYNKLDKILDRVRKTANFYKKYLKEESPNEKEFKVI